MIGDGIRLLSMKQPLNLIGAAGRLPVMVAILCFGFPAAKAAQYTVAMTPNDTFSPNYLRVQVGDTVTWANQDDFDYHDSYCAGYWYSGLLDYNETYSITPSATGNFSYTDTTWGPLGMTGTIVVGPPAAPPPMMLSPVSVSNGSFQCVVSNLVLGTTNLVQASTDFVNWVNVFTNVAIDYSFQFVDLGGTTFSARFYRAVVLP
jgi:plastocyanin